MTGTRIWALGTAVVIVAVLALGWLLGVSPMLTRLAAAEEQVASTEAANLAQEATLEVMKTQFEELPSLESELAALRVQIPGAVDSDFIYAMLAFYQESSGATVEGITTGEAQPYGMTAEGEPATEGVAPIADLYTVPVTVTFANANVDGILAFVAAMQRGPRLFLITSVASGGEGAESTATITAYMFVIADPEAPVDGAMTTLTANPYDPAKYGTPLGPAGEETKPEPETTETPAPEESDDATPAPTGSPTPTP